MEPKIKIQVISTWTQGKRGSHRRALCICGCGKEFEADFYKVKTGHTKSCGCFSKIATSKTMMKHGMRNSREYNIWCGIKKRCLNKNVIGFENYGGRGISICSEWADSFDRFFSDMGACPDGMSIERNDTNGNYEPSNCRWATVKEQSVNKRNSLRVIFNGLNTSIIELASQYGIKYHTLRYRILKMGLQPEEAIRHGK